MGALFVFLLLFVSGGLSARAGDADGRIVWASRRAGTYDIWSMEPDGSDKVQITSDAGNDHSPALSPDGSQIAFVSDRNGSPDRLFVMRSDGAEITEIAAIAGLNAHSPSWSPDGDRIYAGALIGASQGQLFAVDPDGQNLQTLLTGYASRPFVSPDGTTIVFDKRVNSLSFSHHIFSMGIDGSNVTERSFGSPSESTTANSGGYSPDGVTVAYTYGHALWLMDADFTNQRVVLDDGPTSGRFELVSFSFDGQWLVFDRDPGDGNRDIYKCRLDGSDLTRLTTDSDTDFAPRWGHAPPPTCNPGDLAVDPPVTLYDVAQPSTGSFASGTTRYLIRADVDADGREDLVNVTSAGAQVFRNLGPNADGAPQLDLLQELLVPYSLGGGAADMDGDQDVDLVLGGVNDVFEARNDGTGHFVVRSITRHRFGVPTMAMPFRESATGGGAPLVLLAPVADAVSRDDLQANPARRPYAYVLVRSGQDYVVSQRLGEANAGGIAVADVDQDGTNELLLGMRSSASTVPFVVYRRIGASYERVPDFDRSGVGFGFGFSPAVSSEGHVAVGTWHRTSVWRRNALVVDPLSDPGTGFLAPIHVAAPAGPPTAEVFATAFADMDADGFDDLLVLGWHTPLLLAAPTYGTSTVFVANAPSGSNSALAVADWDGDACARPDVIVGGDAGLHFHRNGTGGEAGPGVPADGTTAYEHVLAAMETLDDVMAPLRAPAFLTGYGRDDLAVAYSHLYRISPAYVATGDLGAVPADALNGIYDHVLSAAALIHAVRGALPAEASTFEPLLTASLTELARAATQLVDEALALTPPLDLVGQFGTVPAKRAYRASRGVRAILRRAECNRAKAQRSADRAQERLAAAQAARSDDERVRLLMRVLEGDRGAFRRAVRSARLVALARVRAGR